MFPKAKERNGKGGMSQSGEDLWKGYSLGHLQGWERLEGRKTSHTACSELPKERVATETALTLRQVEPLQCASRGGAHLSRGRGGIKEKLHKKVGVGQIGVQSSGKKEYHALWHVVFTIGGQRSKTYWGRA